MNAILARPPVGVLQEQRSQRSHLVLPRNHARDLLAPNALHIHTHTHIHTDAHDRRPLLAACQGQTSTLSAATYVPLPLPNHRSNRPCCRSGGGAMMPRTAASITTAPSPSASFNSFQYMISDVSINPSFIDTFRTDAPTILDALKPPAQPLHAYLEGMGAGASNVSATAAADTVLVATSNATADGVLSVAAMLSPSSLGREKEASHQGVGTSGDDAVSGERAVASGEVANDLDAGVQGCALSIDRIASHVVPTFRVNNNKCTPCGSLYSL